MSIETHTYSISSDTPNNKVDEERLFDEIYSSPDIIIGLSNLSVNDDVLTINFKAAIGTAATNDLDAIVANHSGEPMERPAPQVHYVEELPQGGKRVADRGFFFEAQPAVNGVPTDTTFDLQIVEDLYVKDGYALAKGYDFCDKLTMSIIHPVTEEVLHTYIKDSPFHPTVKDDVGKAEATNKAITETNFFGLKIRFTYTSHSTQVTKVNGIMRAYK